MIEIEASQKVLIGLAGPGVLGGDHAGDRFQQFRRLQEGPDQQVRSGNGALAGRMSDADLGLAPTKDHNLLYFARRPGGDLFLGGERSPTGQARADRA